MKILKPGKVEQRKFVCDECCCEFVADSAERSYSIGYYVLCPHCNNKPWWSEGEPYEEPTPTQADRERLESLIANSPMGTEATTAYLLSHGVTFREG